MKVLLVRFSSLGDVVLTSALLKPLTDAGFEVHLLTHPPFDRPFADDPRLKTITVSRKNFKRELPALLERLKRENYDAVLDLHANLKSRLISTLLRSKIKATYPKNALRRRLCVFLNRLGMARGMKEKPFSVVKAYAQTLKALGLEVENPKPFIKVNDAASRRLKEHLGLWGAPLAVLGVGARYRKKEYPYFGEVAKLLTKRGFKVVLVGDGSDAKKIKPPEGVLNLCGKLDLLETMRLLKGADLFVGNDSGATHMARAAGVLVFTIFGATHPCLGFAPSKEEGEVITKNLPCSPCTLHGGGECSKNYECLKIDPALVVERIEKRLKLN